MLRSVIFLCLSSSFAMAGFLIRSGGRMKWDYNKPTEWARLFPMCNGRRQSPINIDLKLVVKYPQSIPEFKFLNYDEIIHSFVFNNGHSLVLQMSTDNLKDSQLPSITGGGLRGRYIFDQLHFHWSSDLIEGGSEHTIDYTHYPCELHLVHFNSKYANITAAANHADGIAVLGVFMEESEKSNIPMRHFINLIDSAHTDIDMLLNVKPAFPLMDLLPDETDSFYRYSGSLTTPGCQESVTWTLFDSPVQISARQITKLGTLVDENGKRLAHNNRPVQPLNYRKVEHYNTTPGASCLI